MIEKKFISLKPKNYKIKTFINLENYKIKNLLINKKELYFLPFKLKKGWKFISKFDNENKTTYYILHTKTKTIQQIAILHQVI